VVAELPVSASFTLTDKILARGATPSNGTPRACRSLAAMMAATAVPWPTQSWKPVLVGLGLAASTLPANWGL
jgi:hypothetical protein